MTRNDNHSILPFYDTKEKWHHLKPYSYGEKYPLITPSRFILPFQVIRAHQEATPLTVFKIIEFDTGTEHNALSEMLSTENLQIREYPDLLDGYDIIMNYGKFELDVAFDFEGYFYIEMSDGTDTWYSELFLFVKDVSKMTKVVFYDRNQIREIYGGHFEFRYGFQNFFYINNQIGKPKYPITEEGDERDGFFYPEKQISEKLYVFEFVAPEFLLDAIRAIRLHDWVFVQDEFGDIYQVEEWSHEPEWQEQGDLATVEVEFHTNTIIKKIGQGYDFLATGDFNDDFNDDFDTEGGGEPETGIIVVFPNCGFEGTTDFEGDINGLTFGFNITFIGSGEDGNDFDHVKSVITGGGFSGNAYRVEGVTGKILRLTHFMYDDDIGGPIEIDAYKTFKFKCKYRSGSETYKILAKRDASETYQELMTFDINIGVATEIESAAFRLIDICGYDTIYDFAIYKAAGGSQWFEIDEVRLEEQI